MTYPKCDLEQGKKIQKEYEEWKVNQKAKRDLHLFKKNNPWLQYKGAERVQLHELNMMNGYLKNISSALVSIEKKLSKKEEEK